MGLQADPRFSKIKSEICALITHWCQEASNGHSVRLPDARLTKLLRKEVQGRGCLAATEDVDLRIQEDAQILPGLLDACVPFPPPVKPEFTFIDLFAGIGGFRLAAQNEGGKCVFSSEWNEAAQQTYLKNYGELPFGDIRQFTNKEISDTVLQKCIPKHDVLCAGFPCQPFSHAGVSARQSLGRSHGFDCATQGTLFFDLIRIAKALKPKVLILENVRNLMNHDKGNTFKIIRETIEKDLKYSFFPMLVDARTMVPQKRVRCFMVCFRDTSIEFDFPNFGGEPKLLKSILEPSKRVESYTISDRMWAGHQRRTIRNIARGAGFTTYAASLDAPSNTIVARYWKDGKECLVPQKGKNPRTLTPRECARLQGFPEEFIIPERKKDAYMQFGNSVVVPVVERIVNKVKSHL